MKQLILRIALIVSLAGMLPLLWTGVQAEDVNRSSLPIPDQPFKGKIGLRPSDSVKDFPKEVTAPEGAPNVLLILTDDVGFGASSTFGGPIPTPTYDRLAAAGIRYNQFHTTALCFPTRAALLTGRNHHSVATGGIMEIGVGYPGYNTLIPKSKRGLGDILKLNGYNTAWFGKNHNVPDWHTSQAGPFDLWPVGLGFEYFYGFVGSDTNQQAPVEGVSIMYTFDDASAPSRHTTQYFEMFANRAIYGDGWVAATTPPIPPWVSVADAVDPIEGYDWELYNIAEAKLTEEQLRQCREGRVKAAMAQ